jgi:hypothetical protein
VLDWYHFEATFLVLSLLLIYLLLAPDTFKRLPNICRYGGPVLEGRIKDAFEGHMAPLLATVDGIVAEVSQRIPGAYDC